MSFENFNLFNKKEVTPVDKNADEERIIANILNELKAEGITNPEVPQQPSELNPGVPKHPVYNEPRKLPKPEYSPNVSPDSTVPPKPPATS